MTTTTPSQEATTLPTNAELEAMEARANAATDVCHVGESPWPGNENLQWWVETHWDGFGAFVRREDAEFHVAARTDIPTLISAVRSLKETKANLIDMLEGVSGIKCGIDPSVVCS